MLAETCQCVSAVGAVGSKEVFAPRVPISAEHVLGFSTAEGI